MITQKKIRTLITYVVILFTLNVILFSSLHLNFTTNMANSNALLNISADAKDTTPPTYSDLTLSADPLELGDTEIFSIKAYDESGIKDIEIELEGEKKKKMKNIGGDTWQYDSWTPSTPGNYTYKIKIKDKKGNINQTEGSLEVKDTIMPICMFFETNDEIDFGGNFRISINAEDSSGIRSVLVQLEGHTFKMNNIRDAIWEYVFIDLREAGTFTYTIMIEDNGNNILTLERTFTVLPEVIATGGNSGEEIPMIMILSFLGIIGAVSSIAISVVKIKKSKVHKQISVNNNKITIPLSSKKSLIARRNHLEGEAIKAIKVADFTKAAELYGKCKSISNQLFKEGMKDADTKRRHYTLLETEAKKIDNTMAVTTTCINELMTKVGDENGHWYYSEPQIYHNNSKMTDGLILNEDQYLKTRIDELSHEKELSSEVGINLFNIEHVKAIQFVYTNNISTKNFLELVINYQTPDMMLFIVCLKCSKHQNQLTLKIPQDDRIKYRENACVINNDVFKELIGLKIKDLKQYNKIIQLNNEMNVDALNKIHDSNEVLIHDTDDLIDDLQNKGLIEKEFCEYFQIPVNINGSEEILMPVPQGVLKANSVPRDAPTHVVPVICPTCKTQKKIRILDSIISQAKQLTTISLLKGLVCEHGFQFFVDKNFKVRGYQKVDVEVNAANNKQIEIVDDSK